MKRLCRSVPSSPFAKDTSSSETKVRSHKRKRIRSTHARRKGRAASLSLSVDWSDDDIHKREAGRTKVYTYAVRKRINVVHI